MPKNRTLENDFCPNTCIYQKKTVILQAKLKSHTAYGKETYLQVGNDEVVIFNVTEFSNIRMEAGTNGFVLTSKQWIERTNAIGIVATPGRYGGTYAHKDIAFEFASWLSPEFLEIPD